MAKAIIFQPQSSNPLPSNVNGMWVNNLNQMMFVDAANQTQNVSLGASGKGVYVPILNNTGSTLTKGTVVSVNSSGELQRVDVSVGMNASRIVGIVSADAPNTTTALVCSSGVIENLTTSLIFGDQVYASATVGALYGDEPTVGVDGFISGDYAIRVGVLYQNAVTPGQKDLAVNIQIVGIL